MLINFTDNYQFTTRLLLKQTNVEIINGMKILGTIINDKLTWNENCKEIISKVNKRMLLLKKTLTFGATREEMVHLWIVYCRSVLEQSAEVWSSSLTQENKNDLERTQKSFAKLILRNEYTDEENAYEHALLKLNLEPLEQRRNELCLRYAKNGIKNKTLDDLFPENESKHPMNTRHHDKFQVYNAKTERMRRSSIVFMQNLLNEEYQRTKDQDYLI